MRILLLLIFFLFTNQAQAILIDLNTFYFSDTFSPGSSNSTFARTAYDLRVGFSLDKKSRYFIGWNYSGVTVADQLSSGNEQYTSTEMGPSFLWVIDRNNRWILSLTYNLVSTAQYTPAGGSTEKWKGTTLKAYLGYNIQLSEYWFFGPTLNYYSASFNEKIENESTYTQVSITRSMIYPGIYLGYRF